jgi:hypothetical protein
MDTKLKKIVATVALAGAITAGTAGAAFAADGTSGGTTTPNAQALRRHPRLFRNVRQAAIKIVVDTVGGTRQDLRAALQSGKTISQYAGDKSDAVVTALVNAADAKVDQAVAAGKITPERGATIKSKVPDRVNTLVNRQFGQHA